VWQHVHERLGLWDGRAEEYWRRYRAGEIDYAEFCSLDAAHWEGVPEARARAFADELPYNPGVSEGLRTLRALGPPIVLVSTGLTLLTDRIVREFGLDAAFTNELVVVDGALTGAADVKVQDGAKGQVLDRVTARFGVAPERMVAVGDSYNDVDVARRVGWFVAYRCSDDELAGLADHVCTTDNFCEAADRVAAWYSEDAGGPRG
jgi:phosphoserine phosphatase